MTHGAIDGYSRLVVYLKVSSNNRSTTVYQAFLKAVEEFGLPSRVRSDQGRENILVAQHMLEHRGEGRGSVIAGSSTHNQRIERLWRDMHRCVTSVYYRLFYHLEQLGALDPLNELHVYALHYVFIPRIRKSLEEFKSGWNNHAVRTESHYSPHQLFVRGALSLQASGLTALDFFDHVDADYGAELGFSAEESEGVVVPECQFPLLGHHYASLRQEVDPLSVSENYGIEIYQQTLQFVATTITENRTEYQQWIA